MKLADWIESYGVDADNEEVDSPEDAVKYIIPSYKIGRLRTIEEELEEFKEIGEYEEIKEVITKASDRLKSDIEMLDRLKLHIEKLEASIEKALPSMLPKLVEYFEPILEASKKCHE